MQPVDIFKTVIQNINLDKSPGDFEKRKETLVDLINVIGKKEKEIMNGDDPTKKKIERMTSLMKLVENKLIPELEAWKDLYPEKVVRIEKAVKISKTLVSEYKGKIAKLRREEHSAVVIPISQPTERHKSKKIQSVPSSKDTLSDKEAFWKNILKHRTNRGDKGTYLQKNADRVARAMTNSIKSLDVKMAKILIKYRHPGQTLCLDGLKDIKPEVLKILIGDKGHGVSLNGLTKDKLTPELLKLINKAKSRIFLMGIEYGDLSEKMQKLAKETKSYNIQFKDGGLSGGGFGANYWGVKGRTKRKAEREMAKKELAGLSPKQLEKAIEEDSGALSYLPGLTSLNDAQAKSLSKYKGYLYLSGLTSLNDAQAKSLSEHTGGGLYLSGLTSLNDAQVKSLSKYKDYLDLSGLTSLSDAQAKSLSKYKGDLDLSGLTSLSDAQAKSLSKYKGDLDLSGLTSLNDAQAKSLSEHTGGGLYLSGLTSMSEKAYKTLPEKRGGISLPSKNEIKFVKEEESLTSILDNGYLDHLNPTQKENAQIIERVFREYNLPDNIIAAAIVNAMAESSLDANANSKDEDSVGLFQLNIKGAGHGMTIEERKDPVKNARTIIIREILTERGVRLLQAAADGASIAKLAAIFSKDIERPVDVKKRMVERMKIAAEYFKEEISATKIKQYVAEIMKEAGETMESVDHFRKGNEWASKGDNVKAAESYRKAITEEPGNPLYSLRLANTLASQGKNDDAAKEYWEAVGKADLKNEQHRPILAESYLRLGNISAGKGKEREAFGLYASVLTYAKEDSPIYEEAASRQKILAENFDNWEGQLKIENES